MNLQHVAELLYGNAELLLDSLHESSNKFPVDLGYWAIKENKVETLEKELEKIPHVYKTFRMEKDEFPTVDCNCLELEIRTDSKNKKKISDILKKLNAFELEKFHVANLKERTRRINSALSTLAKKRLFVKNKDANPYSKENIVKVLEHIGAENIVTKDNGEGNTSFKFTLDNVPMYATSSEELGSSIATYKEIKQ